MSLQSLPLEMIYIICQYLPLSDIVSLKECLPGEVENCGILFNFLNPTYKAIGKHISFYKTIQMQCFKSSLHIKKNGRVEKGELGKLRKQVHKLICHIMELKLYQDKYDNLLQQMKLGNKILFSGIKCFGCRKTFKKPQHYCLNLEFKFPDCTTILSL